MRLTIEARRPSVNLGPAVRHAKVVLACSALAFVSLLLTLIVFGVVAGVLGR